MQTSPTSSTVCQFQGRFVAMSWHCRASRLRNIRMPIQLGARPVSLEMQSQMHIEVSTAEFLPETIFETASRTRVSLQFLPSVPPSVSGFGFGLHLEIYGHFLDSVDFGWSQAAAGGCDQYSGRFDINSRFICLVAVRFDTISRLF